MIDWIQNVMNSMGYPGIALLMFLENVFPPLPGVGLCLSPVSRRRWVKMSFFGVVIAGAIGSLVGQIPLYYLGKIAGRSV